MSSGLAEVITKKFYSKNYCENYDAVNKHLIMQRLSDKVIIHLITKQNYYVRSSIKNLD